MKRIMAAIGIILALMLLLLPASAALGSTGPSTGPMSAQGGKITIQSWLYASPSKTGLSGTVVATFKLEGAFTDEGGQPTWTDSTYATPTALPDKGHDWQPAGGFVLVPPVNGGTLSTVYAIHTVTGQKGQFFITFSGTYDFVKTYQGSGTWVITGGTGAYEGAQGSGTWTADATHFPYIRHTEVGEMHLLQSSTTPLRCAVPIPHPPTT
jgi:hypothetical protein